MQRRAAAISVAFFLVLSAGAYVTLSAAEEPTIQVDNPDYALGQNQTLSPGDITYTVTDLGESSAKLEWTNQSYRYTNSFANGSQIQYRDGTYDVVIPNETDPTQFTLRENQTVDAPTVTQDGTVYVVVKENNTTTFVPRDEYLPDPQTYTFEETDGLVYENQTWTVGNITTDTVPVYRIDSNTFTISLSEGGTQELAGTEYVAHFANGELLLSSDVEAYNTEIEHQNYFHERIDGLWGVSIISGVTAAFLIMLAFLPPRY